MILPGKQILSRLIIPSIRVNKQLQPCGIDLTLKHALTHTTAGLIGSDDRTPRRAAMTQILSFDANDELHLKAGSYVVEFNESVNMPLDVMGQIFTRSSLWRSGATIHAGIVDSGYRGVLGGLLVVGNGAGLRLGRNARLAQLVCEEMSGGDVEEGYSGAYQERGSM